MSEEKKKSKKGLIIALLLIIVIIAVAVAVVVLMNGSSDEEKAEEEKTTGVEWGDNYYVYLLEDLENDIEKIENEGLKLEEIEIAFVELEDFDYPVMLIEGLLDGESIFTSAYIEDDEVKLCDYIYTTDESDYAEVAYLYNIEDEEYDWYVCIPGLEGYYYQSIPDYIEDRTIVEDDENEGYLGLYIEIEMDFEKEYIETGVEPDFTEVDLSNEDDLLVAVTTATESYVENEELLTDDIIEEVEEKLEELLAEEENSGYIQVGDYILEYGEYVGTDTYADGTGNWETFDVSIKLNKDGTCERVWSYDDGTEDVDDGVFAVGEGPDGFADGDVLYLYLDENNEDYYSMYVVYADNQISVAAGTGSSFTLKD